MEVPLFNIYRWIDTFKVIPNPQKLIDIYDWISIILNTIPEYFRNRICTSNLFIEIPKPQEIRPGKYKIQDLLKLRQTDLLQYVFIAKQQALKNPDYIPNKLVLTIEDDDVIENPVYEINPFLHEDIATCQQPIILIFVGIIKIQGLKILSHHANALIIDKVKKTYELFDPYGKTRRSIDEWFNNDFREMADLQDYTYLSPMILCPNLGPQYIAEKPAPKSERGYCMSYTFMYIQMRLANPELSPQTVVEILLSKSPQELRHYAILYNTVLHEYFNWPYRN